MEIRSLILMIVVAVAALLAVRIILSLIRTSAKFIMWCAAIVLVLAVGFLWLQQRQDSDGVSVPKLSMPARAFPSGSN